MSGNLVDTQEECDALVTLPTLTRLDLSQSTCSHIDVVASLPQLRSLAFGSVLDDESFAALDWSRIATALRSCVRLTELRFHCYKLTSEQLASILPAMPLLQTLSFRWTIGFNSLSFLRSGTLPTTLVSFSLCHCTPQLSPVELDQLHVLQALQTFRIVDVFDRELEEQQLEQLRVPSLLMPALRDFYCRR